MRTVTGFPYANGAEPLTVSFDHEIPKFDKLDWETEYRKYWHAAAEAFVDRLGEHLPQALMDAVLAELCKRKAALLHTTSTDLVVAHKRTLALEASLRKVLGPNPGSDDRATALDLVGERVETPLEAAGMGRTVTGFR